MEIGMVGLGKMGGAMSARLVEGGHRVVVNDVHPDALASASLAGAQAAATLDELVDALTPPRAVWIMVPAGEPTERLIRALAERLERDEIVIDGGNSYYRDTLRRAAELGGRGIHLVDVGTSGGIWGREHGYSLMVGGDLEPCERIRPALMTLAPAPDAGWGRVGPSGAGHFAKMVHNGIEYGLMQAYAEGFEILERKRDLQLDLRQIAEIWRSGSVVRSWLLDLIAATLADEKELREIRPYVPDSGEGRWTVAEAIDLDVPAPVITTSLLMRLVSRQESSFAAKLLAALRNRFGGHAVQRSASE